MRRLIVALVAALALEGCASSGQLGSEALSLRAKPGTARLVVYRNNAVGLLIQPDYYVDGKKAGNSQPSGFVLCNLAPGRHTVSVGNIPDAIALPISGDPSSITVTLAAGSTTYLRAEPRMGIMMGSIGLVQVAESQGRSDTASLYRIESDCRGA